VVDGGDEYTSGGVVHRVLLRVWLMNSRVNIDYFNLRKRHVVFIKRFSNMVFVYVL